jgi:hypothetical protein
MAPLSVGVRRGLRKARGGRTTPPIPWQARPRRRPQRSTTGDDARTPTAVGSAIAASSSAASITSNPRTGAWRRENRIEPQRLLLEVAGHASQERATDDTRPSRFSAAARRDGTPARLHPGWPRSRGGRAPLEATARAPRRTASGCPPCVRRWQACRSRWQACRKMICAWLGMDTPARQKGAPGAPESPVELSNRPATRGFAHVSAPGEQPTSPQRSRTENGRIVRYGCMSPVPPKSPSLRKLRDPIHPGAPAPSPGTPFGAPLLPTVEPPNRSNHARRASATLGR